VYFAGLYESLGDTHSVLGRREWPLVTLTSLNGVQFGWSRATEVNVDLANLENGVL